MPVARATLAAPLAYPRQILITNYPNAGRGEGIPSLQDLKEGLGLRNAPGLTGGYHAKKCLLATKPKKNGHHSYNLLSNYKVPST